MIEAVLTGLYTKVTELTGGVHNTFYTAIGGRWYDNEAPQEATLPYAVVSTFDVTAGYTFDHDTETVPIDIHIYSEDTDNTEIDDILAKLKTLLEPSPGAGWIILAIEGYTQISFKREFMTRFKDDDGYWNGIVDYIVEIQKT